MQSVRPPVVITRQERFRDPYFDDGCDLLPHHRALQSEPPHLQKGTTESCRIHAKHIIRLCDLV